MAYTTIDKPSDYFNTVLYSGSASSLSVTGVGFQPDLIWIKRRNAVSNHKVNDSVRGTGLAFSIAAAAEISQTGIASFDSDGFTLGTGSADHNTSGGTYASWNWLGANTTASNTDGGITSTVSANTTAGFSIATYTGTGSPTNFGHGLSGKPDLVIIKNRDAGDNWAVIPGDVNLFGGSYYLQLNTTGARVSNSDLFGSYPTATLNYVSTNHRVNASGEDYVCYSFQSIKGYSKIGSYTGNGNADGTFVYTGFKPAWIMIKRYDSGGSNWVMHDTKRDPFNVMDKRLWPSATNAETANSSYNMDFLSNGFKTRNTNTLVNASGGSYIYMAFAENPFVTSTGIPATAR